MDVLPVEAGTYALILALDSPRQIAIGRLGNYDLHAGYYLYLGSARGAGGLRARLGRHLRGNGRPHWHIDYLRKITTVQGWGFRVSAAAEKNTNPMECAWSQWLGNTPGASIQVPRFGASDCRSGCQAHLIHFSHPTQWVHFPITAGLTAWEGLWGDGGSSCGGGRGRRRQHIDLRNPSDAAFLI